jgi:hypothetical protein
MRRRTLFGLAGGLTLSEASRFAREQVEKAVAELV